MPGAAVRVGSAEALPFEDGDFDAVVSQLVIQALDDAPAAAREMRRVAAPGGLIAACVWDFHGGMPLLDAYWAAARSLDPDGARAAGDDSANPWCTRDGLRRLWEEAGIAQVETAELSAGAGYDGFGRGHAADPAEALDDVGDHDDAGGQRDLLACNPAGVPLPSQRSNTCWSPSRTSVPKPRRVANSPATMQCVVSIAASASRPETSSDPRRAARRRAACRDRRG